MLLLYYSVIHTGRIGIQMPEISVVLPLQKALEHVDVALAKDAEAVYNYWVAKRQKAGRPLLERISDEFPWSVSWSFLINYKFCSI